MLTKQQLMTPALLLDFDLFDASLVRMADHARQHGKALRPHAKAHKCVEIARRQIGAGAVGVSVATLGEAELMSAAGVPGLLLTSPVADPFKMARIALTGAMVVADHVQLVEWYDAAARDAGRKIDVLIDLDLGDHRTGAHSLQQAIEIAEAVDRAGHLRLRGLQAYSVLAAHAAGLEEGLRVCQKVFEGVIEIRDALSRKGLSTEILSGGSTGSWQVDAAQPYLTELQAGSYVLMDLAYARQGVDFPNSLTVLATVVSANHEGFVTVDAGFKAFATDRGYGPEARDFPQSKFRWGGDEFGVLDLDRGAPAPRLGQKIEFIPPHCDPTVNLYDRIHVCRGESVEAIWPVKRAGPIVPPSMNE